VVKGETIDCDIVVSGADYHHVETALLDKHDRTYSNKYWQKRKLSSSAMVAFLGVKKQLPGLRHHNLLFDVSWDRHIAQMFELGEWSKKPSVYVGNPTKTDHSLAPKGMETLVLIAPMANGLEPTDEQFERTTLSIVGRIQEEVGYEFVNDIVVADVKAHDYFTESFNAYKGNAFGLSHTVAQSGHRRPKMQSKKVKGLYFTGQDTNPGTSVPLVVLSGKIVADLIQKTEH
jgi:phytoene desaturase